MHKYVQTDGGTYKPGNKKFDLKGECDICKASDLTVIYDASVMTSFNSRVWAFVCQKCFDERDGHLGVGRGQKYERVE